MLKLTNMLANRNWEAVDGESCADLDMTAANLKQPILMVAPQVAVATWD